MVNKLAASILKDFLFEGVSGCVAYSVNYLLKSVENPNNLAANAISLRTYYFTKNVLYYANGCRDKIPSAKHLYASAFNAGVAGTLAATLYSGTSCFGADTLSQRMFTSAVVYAGGAIARGFVEIKSEMQTFKNHLSLNFGKLYAGFMGISFAAIDKTDVPSPAFYWSGEMIDAMRLKKADESYMDVFTGIKGTTPFQVFTSYCIKLAVNHNEEKLPFAGHFIDSTIAILHRINAHRKDKANEKSTVLPVTQQENSAEIKIAVSESKLQESAPQELTLNDDPEVVTFHF